MEDQTSDNPAQQAPAPTLTWEQLGQRLKEWGIVNNYTPEEVVAQLNFALDVTRRAVAIEAVRIRRQQV